MSLTPETELMRHIGELTALVKQFDARQQARDVAIDREIRDLKNTMRELRTDVRTGEEKRDEVRDQFLEMKNRGIGLLIGVGIACGGVGAAVMRALDGLFS